MTSRRLEERRIAFQRYKDDVKKRGKPFYPFAMFEDTVMSVFVVSVIIALATIWKSMPSFRVPIAVRSGAPSCEPPAPR